MTTRCGEMLWCGVLTVLVAGGCGGGGGDSAGTPDSSEFKTTTKGLEYKVVEKETLPKVTVDLPPLDDGRIEITGPTNWKAQSRSREVLAGFYRVRADSPPLINVTVAEWSDFQPATATVDNLDEFIPAMTAKVAGELKEGVKLQEEVYPVVLGGHPWARYVRGVNFVLKGKKTSGMRQILRTVVGGRMYQIELQVFNLDEVKKYRDEAYALAANMKFLSEGTAPAPMPMTEEPATPDPTKEEPGKEKPAEPAEDKKEEK